MRMLLAVFNSSIGKKALTAFAGLLLCGFLVAHLYGNLFLFAGETAFNGYAKALEQNLLFLRLAETGLALLFLLHIVSALAARLKNRRARPTAYAVKKEKKDGFGAKAMFGTALLILTFLAVHLRDFRFSAAPNGLYALVIGRLQYKPLALFYAAAMGALGWHLGHGFQAAFQSLGMNHPKATPAVKTFGLLFAAAVSGTFAAIPLWIGFFYKG